MPPNPFSLTSGSSSVTVTEPNHGRSNSDTVRFRNCLAFDGISKNILESASGYTITKVDSDNYKFTVSASSTSGSIKGGGAIATAGPVTLEA